LSTFSVIVRQNQKQGFFNIFHVIMAIGYATEKLK
jgi:uncharacterized protein with GYD domain